MLRRKSLIILLWSLVFSTALLSQESESQDFNDCVALFLNGQMVVDEYSPKGSCTISASEKGKLTVHTVSLTENSAKAISPVSFRIAIKNERTGTIWMLSDESYTSIQVQEIINESEQGDSILILMEERKYALPHNEISIVWEEENKK